MKRKIELNSFYNRLKQIRESLGQTQEEFAKALNVSKPTIARYEAGGRKPDADFLSILLNKYKINLNWLLTGDETMCLDEEILKNLSPYSDQDEEIKELLNLMDIPEVRRSVLAELDKSKEIFKPQVEKHYSQSKKG